MISKSFKRIVENVYLFLVQLKGFDSETIKNVVKLVYTGSVTMNKGKADEFKKTLKSMCYMYKLYFGIRGDGIKFVSPVNNRHLLTDFQKKEQHIDLWLNIVSEEGENVDSIPAHCIVIASALGAIEKDLIKRKAAMHERR